MTQPTALKKLFADWPEAEALFEMVRHYLMHMDGVTMSVTKTQVGFGCKTKFAWVWLPQMWTKKRPNSSITVSFDLPEPVKHDRVVSAVEARPGHWMHHVVVTQPAEFDKTVQGWLEDAYTVNSLK